MSKKEKLLRKIASKEADVRFAEIRKVLESIGYTMHGPSGGSSHKTFRKKGCPPITIPTHEPIKAVYLMMVAQAIEKEDEFDVEC